MSKHKGIETENNTPLREVDKDIINRVTKFYSSDRKYADTLLDIINGKSDMSIRVIDHFVTNYAKKKDIFYWIKVNGNRVRFDVYIEYNNHLSGYSKNYFDPFCRKHKVKYYYVSADGKHSVNFKSSLGQLYFFYWAIKYKVLTYVMNHLKEIDDDMKQTAKINKELRFLAKNAELVVEEPTYDGGWMSDDDIMVSDEYSSSMSFMSPQADKPKQRKRQSAVRSVYDRGFKLYKNNVDVEVC